MRQKSEPVREPAEQVVKDIRRATRRHFSAEDKIHIVLDGLRGEDSIAELCRREGIVQNLYYRWSKEFLAARKQLVQKFLLDGHVMILLSIIMTSRTKFRTLPTAFPDNRVSAGQERDSS